METCDQLTRGVCPKGNANATSELDEFRKAYAQFQPGVCLINIKPPGYDIRKEIDEKLLRVLQRSPLRATMTLIELILQRDIRTSGGGVPSIFYMDRSTVPTNKKKPLLEIRAELGRGLRLMEKKPQISLDDVTLAFLAKPYIDKGYTSEDIRKIEKKAGIHIEESAFYVAPSISALGFISAALEEGMDANLDFSASIISALQSTKDCSDPTFLQPSTAQSQGAQRSIIPLYKSLIQFDGLLAATNDGESTKSLLIREKGLTKE